MAATKKGSKAGMPARKKVRDLSARKAIAVKGGAATGKHFPKV